MGLSAWGCIIIPRHNRTKRIAVGMSATPTRAEINPFTFTTCAVGEAALFSRAGNRISAFPGTGGSGAKRSARAAIVALDMLDRLVGRPRLSPSPKSLGSGRNV
jgi:hypothetical protein